MATSNRTTRDTCAFMEFCFVAKYDAVGPVPKLPFRPRCQTWQPRWTRNKANDTIGPAISRIPNTCHRWPPVELRKREVVDPARSKKRRGVQTNTSPTTFKQDAAETTVGPSVYGLGGHCLLHDLKQCGTTKLYQG